MKKEKTWKTKDGRILKISEMTDKHLINTIKMIEEKAEDGKVVISGYSYAQGTEGWEDIYYGESYLGEIEEYDWLKEELLKRKNNN